MTMTVTAQHSTAQHSTADDTRTYRYRMLGLAVRRKLKGYAEVQQDRYCFG